MIKHMHNILSYHSPTKKKLLDPYFSLFCCTSYSGQGIVVKVEATYTSFLTLTLPPPGASLEETMNR